MTDLVRITSSAYNEVNRNLKILEKEEIINIRCYGRLGIVELRLENPRTQAVLLILQALRLLEDSKIS